MNKKNMVITLSLIVVFGFFVYSRSQNDEQDTPIEQKAAEPVASIAEVKALLNSLEKQSVTLQVHISQYHIELERVFFKKREQWNKIKDSVQKLTSELKIIINNAEFIEKLRRDKELFGILSNLNEDAKKIVFGTDKKTVIAQIIQLSSLYSKAIATHKLFEKIATMLKIEEEKPEAISEYEAPEYTEELPYEEEYEFETYPEEYGAVEEYQPAYDDTFELDDYGFEFDF